MYIIVSCISDTDRLSSGVQCVMNAREILRKQFITIITSIVGKSTGREPGRLSPRCSHTLPVDAAGETSLMGERDRDFSLLSPWHTHSLVTYRYQ